MKPTISVLLLSYNHSRYIRSAVLSALKQETTDCKIEVDIIDDGSTDGTKEILSQFIGVDIFDKLYQKASDENRDNATLIRKFKSDDFTTKLADIETQLKSDKNEFKLLELNLTSLKDEEELLNKNIISLNEKIIKLNADSGVSIEDLEHMIEDAIRNEEYEIAAEIRDRIAKLKEEQ